MFSLNVFHLYFCWKNKPISPILTSSLSIAPVSGALRAYHISDIGLQLLNCFPFTIILYYFIYLIYFILFYYANVNVVILCLLFTCYAYLLFIFRFVCLLIINYYCCSSGGSNLRYKFTNGIRRVSSIFLHIPLLLNCSLYDFTVLHIILLWFYPLNGKDSTSSDRSSLSNLPHQKTIKTIEFLIIIIVDYYSPEIKQVQVYLCLGINLKWIWGEVCLFS